jgi:hypothetical protein
MRLKTSPVRSIFNRVQTALQLDSVPRDIVIESEQISVWCYPKLGIVHHEMHRNCHGEPFRQALMAGQRALRQHGATGWLSDDRRNGPLPDDDEKWGTSVWFPQTRAAGWRFWAMVMPERAVGKLNVKRFVELYRQRGIEACMFSEPGPAFAWLWEQIGR